MVISIYLYVSMGDDNWEDTFISQLKDSKEVPCQDSEEIGDEEMKNTTIKTFKDAASSLEEVQAFLASCGNYDVFEFRDVIDSVAPIQSKS